MIDSFVVIDDLLTSEECSELLGLVADQTSRMALGELSEKVHCRMLEKTGLDVLVPTAWYVKTYAPGESIGAHMDGSKRQGSKRSFATLLLYLNDVDDGGETLFVKDTSIEPFVLHSVKPVHGRGLVLRQDVLHMSRPARQTKCLLRNDLFLA